MKKAIINLLIILTALLTSCGSGLGDWSYKLPNGYEVWHINSETINIQRIDECSNSTVIPSFVKEFSYDERYVYTRNVSEIDRNNIFEEQYYILDTQEHSVYGPYDDITQFKKKIEELGLSPLKWYRSLPDPNNGNIVVTSTDVTKK